MAKQVLKVAGITQRFGGLAALQNINMEVFAQEIVGVIGPNGAGKTTLFNVITGIYTPTEEQSSSMDRRVPEGNRMRLYRWVLRERFRTSGYSRV